MSLRTILSIATAASMHATSFEPARVHPTLRGEPNLQAASEQEDAYKGTFDCSFYYNATLPNGTTMRSKEARIAASSSGIEIRVHFGAGLLPDPELVSASYLNSRQQVGGIFLEARRADRTDFQVERVGDSQLTYMREAPVLKVGRRWFVGDRVEIDKPEGLIAINASVELMEDFARERVIEIWWKGTKRVTVHAVPVRLSPAQFGAACLRVPTSITRLASGGDVMRAVSPSTKPQLMDFIGGLSPLSANPFDLADRERGNASFRITVGRDGLVKQCDFLKRSGKLPKRSTACERLRSWARFYPATDKAGVPTEGQADFAVNWAGIK